MPGLHRQGYLRDKRIEEAIERHGVLDTDQVWYLYFRHLKTGQMMAQRRLRRLYDDKKVKRARESCDLPYYYYTGRKSGQLEHRLGVNWVYVWLVVAGKKWDTLHSFEYEKDYGALRADAFAAVKNKWEGKMRFLFVEFDVHLSGNEFTKVKQYNRLFESQGYAGDWWVSVAERFPPVLVVTTAAVRAKVIAEKVEQENTHGLEFRVMELDRLKEECRDAVHNKA